MTKDMVGQEKTLPGGRKSLPGVNGVKWPKTEEEAWAMPLEGVMAIPLDVLMDGYEPVTAEEREAMFNQLGKPTGVGLQSGYADVSGEGLPGVEVITGDMVTKNEINFRGLRHLQVMRLGKFPDIKWYMLQITNRNGEVLVGYQLVTGNVYQTNLLFKSKGGQMYGPMETP